MTDTNPNLVMPESEGDFSEYNQQSDVGEQNRSQTPLSLADRPWVRRGTNILAAVLLAVLAFLLWQRFSASQAAEGVDENARYRGNPGEIAGLLPPLTEVLNLPNTGVSRQTRLNTLIPSRSRTDVITYTVQSGDSLIAIAEDFGLEDKTMLWGNFETLEDNPHLLQPGMVLNILPVDGVYYEWKEGDSFEKVAAEFEVEPDAIINFTGNDLDLAALAVDPNSIEPGTWLVVPGGSRPFKDWGPPGISRTNPASASTYGPGHCGDIYTGPVGLGTFIWPTTARYLSGYHYTSIHRGIDIGGAMGNAIYAADSGVVVYSGWSNFGYGNLIVVDHGNGFQTVYAHLSDISVACGEAVYQGGYMGGMGSTGNSTGPHLHFELIYNGTKPNPMDYLK